MAKSFPKLARPPIREELIDFRAAFREPPDTKFFEELALALKGRYDVSTPLRRFEARFEFGEGGISAPPPDTQNVGLRFQSNASSFVFQAQIDGFTVSMLVPYSSWEALVSEAHLLWRSFLEHVKPITVGRIAVRYINQYQAPKSTKGLREWLTCPSEVPKGLRKNFTSSFSRQQIPDPKFGGTILLTQMVDLQDDQVWQIVVDIDVFKLKQFDASEQELWNELSSLRAVKNQVFFTTVTAKSIGLFS